MLSHEEIKLQLTKQFGNIKQSDATLFLEEIVRPIGRNQTRYRPIKIMDLDLLLHIERRPETVDGEAYLELQFSPLDTSLNPSDYVMLYTNQKYTFGDTLRVDLINEKVRIEFQTNHFYIGDDYLIRYTSTPLPDGATYDVLDNTITYSGAFSDRNKDDDIAGLKGLTRDLLDFKEKVKKAGMFNPNFAKRAQECQLTELFDADIVSGMRLLIEYTKADNLKYILQDAFWREKYKEKLRPIWGKWSKIDNNKYLNLNGNNLLDVLGTTQAVLDTVIQYSSQGYETLLSRVKMLDTFLASYCEDTAYYTRYVEPLLFDFDAGMMGLSYLLNVGYKPKELYTYLRKCADTQAISLDEGLYYLSFVINEREIYTGKRTKIFPSNLYADYMLLRRAISNSDNQLIKKYFKNIQQKRADLALTTNAFSIFPLNNSDSENMLFLHQAFRGKEFVFFKKAKGELLYTIQIKRDTVCFNESEIGKHNLKAVYAWAKQNKLLVMNENRLKFDYYDCKEVY